MEQSNLTNNEQEMDAQLCITGVKGVKRFHIEMPGAYAQLQLADDNFITSAGITQEEIDEGIVELQIKDLAWKISADRKYLFGAEPMDLGPEIVAMNDEQLQKATEKWCMDRGLITKEQCLYNHDLTGYGHDAPTAGDER